MIPTEPGEVQDTTAVASQRRISRIFGSAKQWFGPDTSTQWANFLAVQLVIVTILLRLLWITNVSQAGIFDEPYYVNAARVMLGWTVPEGQTYATEPVGIDPNRGHMPLAKLMIAGSMKVLGDNPIAWRLPSIFFGMVAIGIMYLLVRRLTGRPWIALMAAFLLSFDNLFFIHGRIATLDMPMVGLMLLGIYLYTIQKPALAGVALALSALAKINGGMGLAVLIAFEVLRFLLGKQYRVKPGKTFANLLVLVGAFMVAFLVVLWPIDLTFTHYQNPLDHLQNDFSFGTSLRNNGMPQGIASEPWDWLFNQKTIPYYLVNSEITVNETTKIQTPLIDFRGEMNPYVIFMLPLALGFMLWKVWHERDKASLFFLAMFAVTYAQPLFFAVFFDRISYLFYMVPVLPALCAGIAYFLLDERIPRFVPLAYCAAILFGFAMQFPFRAIPT